MKKGVNELNNTSRCNQTPKIRIGNSISTNDKDIADEFNRFYTNIGSSIDNRIPYTNKDPMSYLSGNYPHSMGVPFLTTEDAVKAIKALKDKNDRLLPTHLIKSNADSLAKPISQLFNDSIATGVFLHKFKHTVVTPIYKTKK